MTIRSFAFLFDQRYVTLARPFGISPERTSIEIGDGRLRAHFGPWRVDTALANVARVSLTGPYALVKTAGPARLTLGDRGLTFATNSRRGVQIDFHEPVAGIDWVGIIRHPNLTVTPGDCAGLMALLRR